VPVLQQAEFGVSASSGGVVCAAGHSVGEFSALVFANSLPLAAAVQLLVSSLSCRPRVSMFDPSCGRGVPEQHHRGRLMTASAARCQRPTAMSALMPVSSEAALHELCATVEQSGAGHVQIANINSKDQVAHRARRHVGVYCAIIVLRGSSVQMVISGIADAVAAVEALASSRGVARRSVRLRVSAPFHSRVLLDAAAALRSHLDTAQFSAPSTTVLRNVDAAPHTVVEMAQRLEDQVRACGLCVHACGEAV
jgi:[acyl-carrier-protein] S-malonyltransferase